MKKAFVFLGLIIVSLSLSSQIHVPASKSMVGVWRLTGVMNDNGEFVKMTTGIYKVINPDGTTYTIATWGNNPSTIGFYATYTITSDSTYTEHIIKHGDPAMNGKDSELRFKLTDENSMRVEWKLDNRWISQSWTRLQVRN